MTTAAARTLTITIPMCPPLEVSPNRRTVAAGRDPLTGKRRRRAVTWREKAEAVQTFRTAAKYAAIQAAGTIRWVNGGPIFTGPVEVRAVIAWPAAARIMDTDNATASTKAIWDGFEDAEIYTRDRQIRRITVEQTVDPDGAGYVEVEIREVTP